MPETDPSQPNSETPSRESSQSSDPPNTRDKTTNLSEKPPQAPPPQKGEDSQADTTPKVGGNTHATAEKMHYILRNRTGRAIAIQEKVTKQRLVISPFGHLLVEKLDNLDYLKWEQQNLLRVEKMPEPLPKSGVESLEVGAGCLTIPYWIVFGVIGALVPAFHSPWYFGPVIAIGIIIFIAFNGIVKSSQPTAGDLELEKGRSSKADLLNSGIILVLILTVGLILPALAIYLFGDGNKFLPFDISKTTNIPLLGRIFQLFFLGIASTLPAMLYIQFERQQGNILRQNFYRDVVMLNPAVHNLDQAEANYGQIVDEVYASGLSSLYLRGSLLPILTSTLLIMLGWLLVLLPIGPATGIKEDNLINLLSPSQAAFSFGFLGAYFFILNMVFRRYVRSDLSAKAYNHITYRLLITLILVWVISAIPIAAESQDWAIASALVTAFLVGIFPESGLSGIRQFAVQNSLLKSVFRINLEEESPLTDLEGMTIYDSSRLLEEGIENVENLAHSNLFELMLRTRIPTNRLVDLIDQAILSLHISGAIATDMKDELQSHRKERLQSLRLYGIRTATDLIVTCNSLDEKKKPDFLKVLPCLGKTDGNLHPLEAILVSMSDDDYLSYLLHWRSMHTQNEPAWEPEEFFKTLTPPIRVIGELSQGETPKVAPVPPISVHGEPTFQAAN